MSIETWKAEFYPKPASETTEAEAIDHSLQKWLGLTPENLAKHRVMLFNSAVMEQGVDLDKPSNERVLIDANSCSLCHHFCETDTFNSADDESPCMECPLYQARGGRACDDETDEEWADDRKSPWHEFTPSFNRYGYDPKPMIRWLKRTKEIEALKPVHEQVINKLAKEN